MTETVFLAGLRSCVRILRPQDAVDSHIRTSGVQGVHCGCSIQKLDQEMQQYAIVPLPLIVSKQALLLLWRH